MSLELLREACKASGVSKVGIVDDVFDPPEPGRLDRTRYAGFRRAYGREGSPLREIAVRAADAGTVIPVLPSFDDLDVGHIEPFWTRLCDASVAGEDMDAPVLASIADLFREHGDDPQGMLSTVSRILRLFKEELGCEVTTFGKGPDYRALAAMDLVLVDFYLTQGLTPEQASAETVQVVGRIRSAVVRGEPSPSFILVSSRPDDVDHEGFRREARLLRSRFRFVDKNDLAKPDGGHLLDVHDVLEASTQAARIETLVEDWRRAAAEAVDDVHRGMLEFDVADFVYLDCFRLYREGTTLGAYLRWLMTAYLQSKVVSRLGAETWARAETMRLFDVSAYPTGNPEEDKLVKSFEGPSEAVGRAYGAILVDSSRSSATPFPSAPGATDLLEGDMFVRRLEAGDGHEGARVLLVMTPSCDLVVRGGESAPAAATVLLLPGTMKRVDGETKPREMADQEFVHVEERRPDGEGVTRVYAIDWHLKAVVATPWAEIASGETLGDHERLGRLREPYFNHVRERFVAGVTRIGREVSPLFPEARAGEVHLRIDGGPKPAFRRILDFTAEDALIWSFPASLPRPSGPAKPRAAEEVVAAPPRTGSAEASGGGDARPGKPAVVGKPKMDDEVLFHVSRRFLAKLVDAIGRAEGMDEDRRTALVSTCRSLAFSLGLLTPGRKGQRTVGGQPKVIEIKVGEPANASQPTTQSALLLLIHK